MGMVLPESLLWGRERLRTGNISARELNRTQSNTRVREM
jgi:hypothetical protein